MAADKKATPILVRTPEPVMTAAERELRRELARLFADHTRFMPGLVPASLGKAILDGDTYAEALADSPYSG